MNKPNCCEKCSGTEEIHTCECHIVKTTTDTQVLEECKGNKACSKFMHISKRQVCGHGGHIFGCAICFDAAVEKRIQQDRAYLAGEAKKMFEPGHSPECSVWKSPNPECDCGSALINRTVNKLLAIINQ